MVHTTFCSMIPVYTASLLLTDVPKEVKMEKSPYTLFAITYEGEFKSVHNNIGLHCVAALYLLHSGCCITALACHNKVKFILTLNAMSYSRKGLLSRSFTVFFLSLTLDIVSRLMAHYKCLFIIIYLLSLFYVDTSVKNSYHVNICGPMPSNEALCGKTDFELWPKM